MFACQIYFLLWFVCAQTRIQLLLILKRNRLLSFWCFVVLRGILYFYQLYFNTHCMPILVIFYNTAQYLPGTALNLALKRHHLVPHQPKQKTLNNHPVLVSAPMMKNLMFAIIFSPSCTMNRVFTNQTKLAIPHNKKFSSNISSGMRCIEHDISVWVSVLVFKL